MKVKTVNSFFPTKIPIITQSPAQSNCQTYKLIKKKNQESYIDNQDYSTENRHLLSVTKDPSQHPTTINLNNNHNNEKFDNLQTSASQNLKKNIFNSGKLETGFSQNIQQQRPVGGIQLFKKYNNIKNKNLGKSRKNSFNPTNREIQSGSKINTFKRSSPKSYDCPVYVSTPFLQDKNLEYQQQQQQQVYKQHQMYDTACKKWKQRPSTSGTYKNSNYSKNSKSIGNNTRSMTAYNKKFKDTINHSKWVAQQNKAYQTKMSYRNQIFYKQPLVERYGDRYFEQILRNRYQDDLQPPTFIHQIQNQQQPQYIQKDRFISKLRKIKPNIKKYERLSLKGKHIERKTQNHFFEEFQQQQIN